VHRPHRPAAQNGFTLVELMLVVAILGLISAVAIPLYNGYIDSAREGALLSTMSTMQVYQEDLRVRTGAYASGTYDTGGGDTTLVDNLGWEPQDDDGTTYVVAAGANSYTVTATAPDGTVICRQYPGGGACP
jgi:prepilin-type N-terminal cleavage/methylation domain-containing protein